MACEHLKQKYQRERVRIQSMCKAIGGSTQTQVASQVLRNGTVRFEIVGRRVKRVVKYVLDEFCKVC